jgi:hypothetical protein
MAGKGSNTTPARRRFRGARALTTAVCALVIAISAIAAPAVLANGPAGGEYKLHFPKAGGPGVGDPGGGSGGLVLLIAGAVVVAGAGALVYVKRRGKTGEAT